MIEGGGVECGLDAQQQWLVLTEDAARCPADDVLSVVQLPDVLPNRGTPDTRVALYAHVVTQS